MQYFAVLEDSKTFRWQAELLFQSLKLLGLEDQFVIAICPGSNPISTHSYPHIISFENVGKEIRFPHFNKCFGLLKAIKSGILKQPFVLLDTDMFVLNAFSKIDCPVDKQKGGSVYQFNDVPFDVFENIVKYSLSLHDKYKGKQLHELGFVLGIKAAGISISEKEDYEMPLVNCDKNCNVVHYREGYLPYFHKDTVYDGIDFSFDMPLPFKLILNLPFKNQPNVSILQALVRSWLEFNLIRVNNLI